jgi:hypothetical protein
MTAVVWSLLPSDLINSIADRLLANNDLDYYMDLRGVCSNWRSVTADPRCTDEPRFRPLHWVLLDEASRTDSRLFVNTVTGRFLRRDLPILDKFYFITTTTAGLLVLSTKDSRSCVVLNPFTGSMIRFAAPIPYGMRAVSAVLGSSSTTIVMFCKTSHKIYYADTDVEQLAVLLQEEIRPLVFRFAFKAGVCAVAAKGGILEDAARDAAHSVVKLVGQTACHLFEKDHPYRCFMVESAATTEIFDFDEPL